MRQRFIDLLKRSDMDENAKRSIIPTLRTLTIISILGTASVVIITMAGGFERDLRVPTGIMLLITITCYVLLQRGMLLPSQVMLPATIFLGITYIAVLSYGLHDESLIGYAFVIVLAQLMIGQRAAFMFAGLSIVSVFAIGIAEISGALVSETSHLTRPATPFVISLVILATTFAQRTLANLLNHNVRLARENEQKQISAIVELRALQHDLEKRVASRTFELDEANRRNEERANQFQAITEVSRTITLTDNLQELLPKITTLVSQLFNFYHVGIFLNDANDQYAVLNAANSEGGARMLQRGHQLRIGEQGIVGYVTATGDPRISLDVGEDAVYFNNPDLPNTRSEIAMPLRIAGKIVGALDVQSTEPNAFSADDVEVLNTLADQVSLAIQNARLFEQTRKSLQESEAVYRQYLHDAWSRLPGEQKLTGFRYTGTVAVPLEEATQVTKSNGDQQRKEVSVPVILRGETIGELSVQLPREERIKSDQMDLIKAVAERVALSIENARLFDETTRRAERERLVSDITTKIRGTNDPQDMIRTAVEELQRVLGATRVEIIPQRSSLDSDK